MSKNIVRTGDFSFQGQTAGSSHEGRGWKALMLFILCMILTQQVTAQYIAYSFGYHPVLGKYFLVGRYPVYPFYRALPWLYELMSAQKQTRSRVGPTGMILFAGGTIIAVSVVRAIFFANRNTRLEALHGTAHWATRREIVDAGLLDEDGQPHPEGVVVGGIQSGKQIKMLRHSGREHILCYAPTRSGKGISLVLPTLLDGWRESAFVFDMKSENFALSAGYRKRDLGHRILRLDFTDPLACSEGTSATFNPLEEVALDYDFADGHRPKVGEPFELVPSGTWTETATIQQIVAVIIDPQGKGIENDHWAKTAASFMLGCITHLLYQFRYEGRGCPGIADVLSELSQPGEEWQKTVQAWQEYPHLGIRQDANNQTLSPLVHPIVAEEAQSILNKPFKEAGSVLSTVVANLALFRDPVVSRNTRKSSFRIAHLMRHEDPVTLYLVVNPTDLLRLTPLTRLIVTQIVFSLARKMDFKDGRSVEGYNHRLLLLLDEFASLGRMDLFERALGFIGGYGLKAFILVQGLPQLYKAYGREESIRVGCHIQVAFAPNDMETAEYISKSTGQATVLKENYSESTQPGKLFAGKSRQTSIQEVQRPLMTPDECRRLPGLRKDPKGDVIEAGDMLIFPAGFPAVYGRQRLYFQDREMDRRSKIVPPVKSDNLMAVIF